MATLRVVPTRLLNLCLPLLLLAGCSDSSTEAAFERYLNRLARPLGGQVQPVNMPRWPAAPRTGALRIALAPSKLGTLDFLSLSGCAVQITIGKRNSSLGKMASDSQRLLLDLEYLQLAPECIAAMKTRGSEALATILADAFQLKVQQLPARIFNATLANREYQLFWQRPASPGDYPQQTSSAVPTALAAINQTIARWLSGDYQFDNQGFETLLAEVAAGDGGALAGALALQQAKLASANSIIDSRLKRGPLCPGSLRPAEADIVDTVMRKYFIGDIQPWSAAVERRRHQLLPPVVELEQQLAAVLPPSYRRWQQLRDQSLENWAAAPRRHVERLQALRHSCSM